MKKALIIIDVQNDYFEGGAMTLIGADKACKNTQALIDKFRRDKSAIVYIQHIASRADASFFLDKSEGAQIHKSIMPLANEKVIIKHYPNSFRDTDLMEYLKINKVDNLVICGMMTHMCVDATTRAAKDLGFDISLISDACATKNLEHNGEIIKAIDVQNSFLSALNYFYSVVQTTEQYLKL